MGPKFSFTDWLSQHNHKEEKDKPIKEMNIRIDTIQNATDIPEFVSMLQIQQASTQVKHVQHLKGFIIVGWSSTKDKLHSDLRPYWS